MARVLLILNSFQLKVNGCALKDFDWGKETWTSYVPLQAQAEFNSVEFSVHSITGTTWTTWAWHNFLFCLDGDVNFSTTSKIWSSRLFCEDSVLWNGQIFFVRIATHAAVSQKLTGKIHKWHAHVYIDLWLFTHA